MTEEKKKLYRSRSERMVSGVCGGLAEYFDIDPTVVRLLFVAGTLIGGPGLIAYLICMVLMPLEPLAATEPPEMVETQEKPAE